MVAEGVWRKQRTTPTSSPINVDRQNCCCVAIECAAAAAISCDACRTSPRSVYHDRARQASHDEIFLCDDALHKARVNVCFNGAGGDRVQRVTRLIRSSVISHQPVYYSVQEYRRRTRLLGLLSPPPPKKKQPIDHSRLQLSLQDCSVPLPLTAGVMRCLLMAVCFGEYEDLRWYSQSLRVGCALTPQHTIHCI